MFMTGSQEVVGSNPIFSMSNFFEDVHLEMLFLVPPILRRVILELHYYYWVVMFIQYLQMDNLMRLAKFKL